jgi:hypothetical protein
MLFPYGLDHFAQPNTAAGVDGLVNQVHQAGVMTLDPNESIGQYFHDRVYSSFFAIPSLGFGPNVGVPRIWKRSRRAHWAGLALMAGFYRQLESQMRASPINSAFTDQQTGWTPKDGPTGWFPPGKSPPDLSGKTSTSTEWKDFITYYALVYLAFNAGPGGWTAHVQAAEPAAVASGLPLRDYLLFKNSRGSQIAAHLGRFAITLDAYLRLDYMTNEFPGAYSTASADTADPNGRNWGV